MRQVLAPVETVLGPAAAPLLKQGLLPDGAGLAPAITRQALAFQEAYGNGYVQALFRRPVDDQLGTSTAQGRAANNTRRLRPSSDAGRSVSQGADSLQRADDTGGIEDEYVEPGDFYGIDDIYQADLPDLVEALDGTSLDIDDLEGGDLSQRKKLKLLDVAINLKATEAMWKIWASFEDVEAVASTHPDLWIKCADAAGLFSLPGISAVEDDFRFDAAFVRDMSLIMSREAAEAELLHYGLSGEQTGLSPDVVAQQQQAIDSFQAAATVVAAAVEAQELLMKVPIGYEIPIVEDYSFGEGEPDNFDPAAVSETPEAQPVLFDPLDSGAGGVEFDAPAEHDWYELKELYDEAVAIIAYWTEKSPALYAVMKDKVDSGQLIDLTSVADQQHALRAIDQSLRAVIAAVDKTMQAEIDPLDLKPVHRRLFAGAGQDIGVLKPWDNPFYQSVAKNLIKPHDSGDWWEIAGLGLAAATILVTFAVAGPAGFVAMAALGSVSAVAGAAEARSRFEKADELAVAADAQMREEWAIVDADQAAAERTKAQLALLFAAIDALGVGPELRGLRAAGAVAGVSDEALQAGAKAAGPGGRERLFSETDIDSALEEGFESPAVIGGRIDGHKVPTSKRRRLDIEDISRGADETAREAVARVKQIIGKRLDENVAVLDAWDRAAATVLGDKGPLTESNYEALYNATRAQFWRNVRGNADAKQAFESAGFEFRGGSTTAPRLAGVPSDVPAEAVRVSLDHILEKGHGHWQRALDADNLELTFQDPNSWREIVQMRHPELRPD